MITTKTEENFVKKEEELNKANERFLMIVELIRSISYFIGMVSLVFNNRTLHYKSLFCMNNLNLLNLDLELFRTAPPTQGLFKSWPSNH